MPLNIVNDVVSRAAELQAAGRHAEAETLYGQALAANPHDARALRGMGTLAFVQGRLLVAEQFLTRALGLSADAVGWTQLGDVYGAMGRVAPALHAYERAWQAEPDYLPAMNNAAVVLFLSGNPVRAGALWERVVAVANARGDGASLEMAGNATNNLGEARLQAARPEEALAWHRRALELLPGHAGIASNCIRDLSYIAGMDPLTVKREADGWWERFTGGVQPMRVSRPKEPERKLRVGFVSPDFREHAVAHFLFPLFERHDRERFEFVGYACGRREDDFTRRLAGSVQAWRTITGADDALAARQIEADGIDMLIDLAGHTGENRLSLFAHRAAPVQAAFLGYPGTVGGAAIEYRLTDAAADPPGMTDSHFSERLVRLPRCAWCYRSPVELPPVSTREAGRPLTFGSFNTMAKYSPAALRLWAAVLRAAPGSRLFLKAASLEEEANRQWLADRFAELDVDPGRLIFSGRQATLAEHAAMYAEVDVALDTFPYHGTTTTCEALWMGVPVVTLAGGMHVSRVGASVLGAAGFQEWVAAEEAGYAAAALLAAESGLRGTGLRGRVEASSLRDEAGYARAVEGALRELWRGYCAG